MKRVRPGEELWRAIVLNTVTNNTGGGGGAVLTAELSVPV